MQAIRNGVVVTTMLMLWTLPVSAQNVGEKTFLGASPLVAPRVEELHPMFRFSPRRVEAAIKKGQELARAGKSVDDVLKINTQLPRGIKGERGRSHESSVVCTSLDALDLVLQSFRAANAYEPIPVSAETRQNGFSLRTIDFEVTLTSIQRKQASDAGDVTVDKFLLIDDQNNIIRPINEASSSGVQTGTMTITGYTPVYSNAYERSDISLETTTRNSDGTTSVSATNGAEDKTTVTTTYEPWSETHPYYSARYTVHFPLFDTRGNALVTQKTQKLTLHILTRTGERVAEYKLTVPAE